jgi:large subunit ribosomal protein L25
MEKASLNVEIRENKGKGAARSLRREGSLPAVVYRAGGSTPLSIDTKEFIKIIRHTEGQQSILNLQFPDKSTKLALMKEYQVHPVTGDVLHADFQEVASDQKVTLHIAVHLVGEAIGVKRDKGILEHMLRKVEITCLPENIPAHLST